MDPGYKTPKAVYITRLTLNSLQKTKFCWIRKGPYV